jgi:hypothetical protein
MALRFAGRRSILFINDSANVGLFMSIGGVAPARHSRAALTTQFSMPGAIRMILTYPAYPEKLWTILVHRYKLSGVRSGEDLSALRNSCSA